MSNKHDQTKSKDINYKDICEKENIPTEKFSMQCCNPCMYCPLMYQNQSMPLSTQINWGNIAPPCVRNSFENEEYFRPYYGHSHDDKHDYNDYDYDDHDDYHKCNDYNHYGHPHNFPPYYYHQYYNPYNPYYHFFYNYYTPWSHKRSDEE